MATVSRRTWATKEGGQKEAWVVRYLDITGVRRLKTFAAKKEADNYLRLVNTIGQQTPEQIGYRGEGWKFVTDLPRGRRHAERLHVAEAFRAAYPNAVPATGDLALHVIAEVPPAIAVADVDNLLKPLLDSLIGVAYFDDTQICECLIRRIPSSRRRLLVKLWSAPQQAAA